MKKRNKKAIIITAIVMLTGILCVLAGFFGGWFLSLFSRDFDYKNIRPEDLGKTVRTDVVVIYDDIDIWVTQASTMTMRLSCWICQLSARKKRQCTIR